MINKQKLWFLTLFSLILVLSVYYITMPNDLLKVDTTPIVNIENEDIVSTINELDDEEKIKEIADLRVVLTNVNSTIEEKNNAYEKLKLIEKNKGMEEELESIIKEQYNLNSNVNIKDNQIKVTIKSKDNTYELANNIMRSIQEKFNEKMYISVKFE